MDNNRKITFSASTKHDTKYEQHIDQVGTLPGVTLPAPATEDSHGTKERLKHLGRAAKSSTKKLLHIDDAKREIDHGSNAPEHAIENDAGLNPSKVLETEASTSQQIKDKLPKPHSVQELKDIIQHPKEATQNQTAETLAVGENPHLRGNEDDHLVETHEELIYAHEKLKALEQDEIIGSTTQGEANSLHDKIDRIEQDREEKRVAWTSSRYVHSVRILSAQQYKFPFLSSCRWVDESGEPQGAQWSQWFTQLQQFIKHVPQPPLEEQKDYREDDETNTYDQDILLQESERILIASSPLQRWISRLRKLRNWHNPRLTVLWLVVWLAVWSCNRVFTFLYCWTAYQALRTRTDVDKREILKDAQHRADDDDEMNDTFGEMITSFGSSKWLQPTMEVAGPPLQTMMRGAADWLEILTDYSEWKTPRALSSIMVILSTSVVLSSLCSTEFFVRAFTLVLILLFFVDQPLSGRFPNYQQVLMPFHWIFWEVPTKTETAFAYLRQQAQAIAVDMELDRTKASIKGPSGVELFASECVWNDITGNLILTAVDVHFMRKVPRQEMWRRSYQDLVRISKGEGRTSLLHHTSHVAELEFKDGSVEKLLHLKQNDTVFNVIFGFSDLQWRQA